MATPSKPLPNASGGEIAKVARAWLRARGGLRGLTLRFDAVAVRFGRVHGAEEAPRVEHVADAWRL